MSVIFIVLGIYILYLLLRPAIRMWRAYSKMKKGEFDFFSDFFGQPGAQRSSTVHRDGSRKSGWSAPGIKKKKIPGDVGEYVKFSEIEVDAETETRQTDARGHATYTATEQQVVDVEWEDLPADK